MLEARISPRRFFILVLLFFSFSSFFSSIFPTATAACTAGVPTSGTILTATSGEIKTDEDGAGQSSYPNSESCSWSVQCPSSEGYTTIFIDIMGYTYNQFDSFSVDGKIFYGTVRDTFFTSSSSAYVSWTTNALARSNGIVMKYYCRKATCSSVNETYAITGVTKGMIWSDLDGMGANNRYGKNEACEWTVTCPSGYQKMAVELAGEIFSVATDFVEIFNSTDSSSLLFNTSTYGLSFSYGEFIPGTFLRLRFHSQYAYNGFSLYFTCQNNNCASTHEVITSPSPFTGGRIYTDRDGSGATFKYLNNENCVWNIACIGSGERILLTQLEGALQTGDVLTIDPNVGNTTVITSMFNYPRVTDATSASVTFTSTSTGRYHGFSLEYVCSTTKCSSVNTSGISYNTVTGTIFSDQDGLGAKRKYVYGEVCWWEIDCPAGLLFLRLSVQQNIHSSDAVVVADEFGASIVSWSGIQSTGTYISTTKINVSFSGHASSLTGYGFNLQWECSAQACSSTVSQGTLTSLTGTITSDSDGTGTSPYSQFETCDWTISCPSGYPYVGISMTSILSTGDTLRIYNTSGTQLMHTAANGSETRQVLTTPLNVAFRTVSSGTGFLIHYQCFLSAPCSSVNTSNIDYTLQEGDIFSDTDGAGSSSSYYMNEICQWNIQCGSPSQYIVFNPVAGNIDAEHSLKLSSSSSSASLNNSFSQIAVVPGSSTSVEFTTPAIIGSTFNSGFSLHYICSTQLCTSRNRTSSTVGYDSTGKIVSDIDGITSTFSYKADERCTWTIACSNASHEFITYMYRGSLGSDSTVNLRQGSSKTLASISSNDATKSGIVTGNTVQVDFSAGSSSGAGFDFFYFCTSAQCSSVASPSGTVFSDVSGIIETDSDGGGLTQYAPSERCSWKIDCTGYDTIIYSVIGETSASTSFLQFGNKTYSGIVDLSDTLNASSATVMFVTDSSTATNRGMTVLYRCYSPTMCRSPNASITSFTNGSTGTILSDADGVGERTRYGRNEVCAWAITCPSGTASVLLKVDGVLASMDNLTIKWGSTSNVLTNNFSQVYTIRTSQLFLTFDSTLLGTPSYGWSLQYTCEPTFCSSTNRTDVDYTGRDGAIVSDTDGTGENPTSAGEKCLWKIRCNSAFPYIMLIADTDMSSTDTLELVNSAGNKQSLSGLSTAAYMTNNSDLVHVMMNSSLVSEPRLGFSLYYLCAPRQCLSDIGNTILTAGYGRISVGITVSMSSVQLSPENEQCWWVLKCGSTASISYNVTGSIGPSTIIAWDNVTGEYQAKPMSGDALSISNGIFYSGNVMLRYLSKKSSVGFHLEYQCIEKQEYIVPETFTRGYCYHPQHRGNISGEVYGQLQYQSQVERLQSCYWIIRCASRRMKLTFLLGAKFRGELQAINRGTGGVFNQAFSQLYETLIIPTSEVVITYSSSLLSTFDVNYLCLDRQTFGVGPVRYFRYDADDTLALNGYENEMDELYVLECPGLFIEISSVQTTFLDDTDTIHVIDGDRGVIWAILGGASARTPGNWRARTIIVRIVTDSFRYEEGRGFSMNIVCTATAPQHSLRATTDSSSSTELFSTGVYIAFALVGLLIILTIIVSVIIFKKKSGGDEETTATSNAGEGQQQAGQGSAAAAGGAGSVSLAQRRRSSMMKRKSSGSSAAWAAAGGKASAMMAVADDPTESACVLCLVCKPSCAVVPCGHVCLCERCARFAPKKCAICRQEATSSMQVFFLPPVPLETPPITPLHTPVEKPLPIPSYEEEGTATPTTPQQQQQPQKGGKKKGQEPTDEAQNTAPVCIHCDERPAICAPVPCGHVCLCTSCQPDKCPACDEPCDSIITIFK